MGQFNFISGYWKDSTEEFEDCLVHEYDDVISSLEERIFMSGLSTSDIRNSIAKGDDTEEDYVITGYRETHIFDLFNNDCLIEGLGLVGVNIIIDQFSLKSIGEIDKDSFLESLDEYLIDLLLTNCDVDSFRVLNYDESILIEAYSNGFLLDTRTEDILNHCLQTA